MVIKTDKEGAEAIKQLCDIALKQGGLQVYNGIGQILQAVKIEDEESQPA